MKFLEKIQGSPLKARKVILYFIIICLGAILVWIWVKYSLNNFEGFKEKETLEDLNIPELKENLERGIPGFEIPGGIRAPENSQ